MTLKEMAHDWTDLLDRKAALEAELERVKGSITTLKEQMADQFLEDDLDAIDVDGYRYAPALKTAYSKRSEEALNEAGLIFFDVLREYGLGDIIVEKVDPRTLQSTIKAYAEEHRSEDNPTGLDGDLAAAINAYEYTDVTRTKVAKKKGAKK